MNNYPEHILDIVWQRAQIISADNEAKGFRKDGAEKWIKRQALNQQGDEFGWVFSKQPESINELVEDKTIVPIHWKTAIKQKEKQQVKLNQVSIIPLSSHALMQLIDVRTDSETYWQSAFKISDNNESKGYRKDYYGQWIQKDAFGKNNHEYGWTLAQLTPISDKALIQPQIIPIHIDTEKHIAHKVALIAENTEEAKIKRRRKNLIYHIILFIVSLPGIIFSALKL